MCYLLYIILSWDRSGARIVEELLGAGGICETVVTDHNNQQFGANTSRAGRGAGRGAGGQPTCAGQPSLCANVALHNTCLFGFALFVAKVQDFALD